jgi:hypothetical protein
MKQVLSNVFIVYTIWFSTLNAEAQTVTPFYQPFQLQVDLPEDQRVRFRNPDGSCVQCSIGMIGVWNNVPAAELLLWDSIYGPKVRGGSWPERVTRYTNNRNIPVFNITGPNTMAWIEWSMLTGRGAAIGFKPAHFCTAVGMTPDRQTFYVVDNNRPREIAQYSRSEFIRRHLQSGRWVVILDTPAPPMQPVYCPWWKTPEK